MVRVLVSIAAIVLWCHTAIAQSYPNYRHAHISDLAALISEEEEAQLRANLIELQEKFDIEFKVITINSMSDYGHSGAIEPFATGLFNHWGIGDAERNDGIMMLIARSDREMRLEVGSGYGTSKNDVMQAIIDEDILPYFRRDLYSRGILRGADAVILHLTGNRPGEHDASTTRKAFNAIQRFIDWLGDWLWAIITPLAYIPIRGWFTWRRTKPRICPVDGSKMTRLDEEWDDHHLQKGQITEESLKSVDYDVWTCGECDHVTIEAYKSWFTRYGACRTCGYKTLEGKTTIIEEATYSSTGQKRIDYDCHNCADHYVGFHTIPMKTKSSSSSSSGSSGGGSSSGGGASGSW